MRWLSRLGLVLLGAFGSAVVAELWVRVGLGVLLFLLFNAGLVLAWIKAERRRASRSSSC